MSEVMDSDLYVCVYIYIYIYIYMHYLYIYICVRVSVRVYGAHEDTERLAVNIQRAHTQGTDQRVALGAEGELPWIYLGAWGGSRRRDPTVWPSYAPARRPPCGLPDSGLPELYI